MDGYSVVPGYYYAYLANSTTDNNRWKRGHTKHPTTRINAIGSEWRYKRVAKFSERRAAQDVELGLKGFGNVYQGLEYFEYDYSNRQELYDTFESLCSQHNALSVERSG